MKGKDLCSPVGGKCSWTRQELWERAGTTWLCPERSPGPGKVSQHREHIQDWLDLGGNGKPLKAGTKIEERREVSCCLSRGGPTSRAWDQEPERGWGGTVDPKQPAGP